MRRLLAIALVLVSAPTLAQEEQGAYVGIGYSKIDFENAIYRIDYGGTDSGLKLTGGYRLNDTLAFEVTYVESGTINDQLAGGVLNWVDQGGNPIGGNFTATAQAEVDVMELRVLAHTGNVVFGFSLFDSGVSGSIVGTSQLGPFSGDLKDSESGLSISIGGMWHVGMFDIRAEYEYFDMASPADLYTVGVGLQYGFGQ